MRFVWMTMNKLKYVLLTSLRLLLLLLLVL